MTRDDQARAFVQTLRRLSMHFARVAAHGSRAHAQLSKQELLAVAVLRDIGPCRMGDLAEHLGVVQSAVTPLVDRLEERGLVARRRSEEDRRVWLVELTRDGQNVAKADDRVYEEVAADMLAPLSAAERKTLVRLLDRMAHDDGG